MEERFSAEFLSRATGGSWRGGASGAAGVAFDSRQVGRGDLFFALPGAGRDGHDYAAAAVAAGAPAVVVRRQVPGLGVPWMEVPDVLAALGRVGQAQRRRFSGRVTGISGSCGKTSLKSILATLWEGRAVYVSPGNYNNEIGLPWSLCQLRPGVHRAGVFEAGINQPGEMARLAAMLEPDDVLITSVGEAHLDGLGSLEGVAGQKSVLARAARQRSFLGPSCLSHAPFQDLPGEVWGLVRAGGERPPPFAGQVATFAVAPRPGGLQEISLEMGGARKVRVETVAVSAGLSENLALGILYSLCSGLSEMEVRTGLAGWVPLEDRGLLRQVGGRAVYGDYYNANPLSMRDALRHFDSLFPHPPRVWILGSMGELGADSRELHRAVGAAVPWKPGDAVLFTGEGREDYRSGLCQEHGQAVAGVVERAEQAGSWLRQTGGPIFAKGSRAEKIESLLAYLEAK